MGKANFTGVYQKAGVASRVMVGLGAGCPGFSAAQEGKDLAGALLDSWYAPESRLCCAACSAKPDCDGFAFVDEHCYLKGSTHGTYGHDGCMVRMKAGIPSAGVWFASGVGHSSTPRAEPVPRPFVSSPHKW